MIKHFTNKEYIQVAQGAMNDLDDSVFVNCKFIHIEGAGASISSTFVNCIFESVNWYWCSGFRSSFINCTFRNCDLRGSFNTTSFVQCEFDKCDTGNDSMGGATEWEGSLATECELYDTNLPIVPESFNE